MLFIFGICLLTCSAAASLFFDLNLISLFFPQIFTRYEMYLFDSEHFNLSQDFQQSYLDVISHYSLANMLSHSTIFALLIFILVRKMNLMTLTLISIFFLLTLGTKMFFATWIFGPSSYSYLPIITLSFGILGFLVIFIQQIVKKFLV